MMKNTKRIGLISMAGYFLFLIILVLLHLLRPDKSVLAAFVSEYAVGNYGWLMSIGFFFLATSSAYLFIGLLLNLRASTTSTITLGIFCIGSFLFSIFPTDLPGNKPTAQGLIHGFSALIALTCLGITMIAWSFIFKKNKNWNSISKTSLLFGAASLIILFCFLVCPVAIRGLAERILLLWNLSWLMLVGRKLCQQSFLLKYG